jgi:FMN-dependent NADH-azoreductase
MTRLLRIDASSRTDDSYSRQLTDQFLDHWFQAHPDDELVVRDLVRYPVPHIAQETITGFYTPAEQFSDGLRQATALSDELITELKAADLVLISTPMYNFTLPSALKAWVDHVVRIGHTFSFSPDSGFAGLLQDKRAVVVTASGAAFSSETMQPMDFLTPYLKTLLGFLGFQKVDVITLEGTTIDEAALTRSQATAQEQIRQLTTGR